MDLSAEDKLRIEEQERKRFAEEQYRAYVSAKLEKEVSSAGQLPPLARHGSSKPRKRPASTNLILFVVILVVIGLAFLSNKLATILSQLASQM
jgi:hypothetical protein